MISQIATAKNGCKAFVIQPNPSMSWHTLKCVYCGISAVLVIIGLFWLCMGLPLVLPFAGLEALLLGAGLYWSAWRGGVREVITVGEDRVVIEAGRSAPEWREEFHRHWARVVLAHPGGWYPSRLFICCHGRRREVGRFLNEQERRGLASELRLALLPDRKLKLELQFSDADKCRGLEHVA